MKQKVLYVPPAKVRAEAELRAKAHKPNSLPPLTPEQLRKRWMAPSTPDS